MVGMYASNFNSYGKLFRVMIQGTVESRMSESGLTNIYEEQLVEWHL